MRETEIETEIETESPGGAGPGRYATYVLGFLFLLYVVNFIDRQILAILIEPIKRDLGVSDTAMGFLTGVAFAIFYTFAGIPIARLADRGSRVGIISAGLVLWSGMTAFSGLARSFVQLALARVGVGVGEAALVPPAHSIISDYFPPRRRATAMAVFSLGIYVGIAAGFALGGWIAQSFGWRAAFLAVGVPGLVLALLFRLTVREPPRGASEKGRSDLSVEPTGEVLRFLAGIPALRHTILGAAFHSLGGYAFAAWAPAFYLRIHGTPMGKLGLWLGLAIGIGGAVGALAGGALADRLGQRDLRWQPWLPGLATLLAVPALLGLLFAPNENVSLLFLVPFALLSAVWSGPVFAIVQGLVKLRMRSVAAAILAFVVNLIGLGLGPQLVGILNDLAASRLGDGAIRWSLLIIVLANLTAAVHFHLASRTLVADWRVQHGPAIEEIDPSRE